MKGKSKKAFSHNVEVEMKSGKPQNQALAIAYSLKKRKKMAKGGPVEESASNEKRPMPDQRAADAKMVSHNSGKKPLVDSDWTDNPTVRQAQNKPRIMPLKHPSMVPSNGFSTRMYDKEGNLMESIKPNNGPQQQPEKNYDEKGPNRQGPDMKDLHMKMMAEGGEIDDDSQDQEPDHQEGIPKRRKLRPLNPGQERQKPLYDTSSYAEGGEINGIVSMEDAEEDQEPHIAVGQESYMHPSEDEYMSGEMEPQYAEGGEIDSMEQPQPEADEERHSSIAAAVMSRMKRMAEGGQVDIEENNEEHPNSFYERNEDAALKENMDSAFMDMTQPDDSNEMGDEREMKRSDRHDRVGQVLKRIRSRR
jgi:hypothetical protein